MFNRDKTFFGGTRINRQEGFYGTFKLTGSIYMKKILIVLMMTLIPLSFSFAEEASKTDEKRSERHEKWAEFHKENSALRKVHLEKMRSRHLELIGQLYDLKLKHLNELEGMGAKAEVATTKEERKAIYASIKEQREKNQAIIKDFRENTIKREIKKMAQEFKQELKSKKSEFKK